jgi:hypothetical protein
LKFTFAAEGPGSPLRATSGSKHATGGVDPFSPVSQSVSTMSQPRTSPAPKAAHFVGAFRLHPALLTAILLLRG